MDCRVYSMLWHDTRLDVHKDSKFSWSLFVPYNVDIVSYSAVVLMTELFMQQI